MQDRQEGRAGTPALQSVRTNVSRQSSPFNGANRHLQYVDRCGRPGRKNCFDKPNGFIISPATNSGCTSPGWKRRRINNPVYNNIHWLSNFQRQPPNDSVFVMQPFLPYQLQIFLAFQIGIDARLITVYEVDCQFDAGDSQLRVTATLGKSL